MKYIFLIILSTLLFLGSWQVSRWHQKQEILIRLNKSYSLIPQNINKDCNYQRLSLKQVILNPKKYIYMYAGEHGYYLLALGKLENNNLALINLGRTKTKEKNSIPNKINLEGIILFDFKKPLLITNYDTKSDIWFSFDREAMSKQLETKLEPYMVWVEHANIEGINNNGKFRVYNHHVEYIITWYSIALILVCYMIYGYRKNTKP